MHPWGPQPLPKRKRSNTRRPAANPAAALVPVLSVLAVAEEGRQLKACAASEADPSPDPEAVAAAVAAVPDHPMVLLGDTTW